MAYLTDDKDWNAFKVARNEARQAINLARSQFIKSNLQSNSAAPKKFRAELNNLMPDKKSKSQKASSLSPVDDLGNALVDKLAMANFANTYFANVGPSLANALPPLLNLVLKTNKIPTDRKTRTIVPIHKDGDKKNLSNFRPITLLPHIV